MLLAITKAQVTWLSLQSEARKLIFAKNGATAIEYCLIAAGIALTVLAAVLALGEQIGDFFNGAGEELNERRPS